MEQMSIVFELMLLLDWKLFFCFALFLVFVGCIGINQNELKFLTVFPFAYVHICLTWD